MDKCLTQLDIAQALGVTTAAVSKWETGAAKPRVEMLFRLAEILGVTPEELMAGRRLHSEELDAEAVRKIKENYKHLTLIESHETADVKIRRIFAFLIDWNIAGVIAILLTAVLAYATGSVIVAIFCMLSYPILLWMRDFIFAGRSPGKRLLNLVVLDIATGRKASRGQLLVRNLFLFLMQIDIVVMLVSGKSIGDHTAKTVVVRKNSFDDAILIDAEKINTSALNSYPERSKKRKSNVWKMVTVIVCSVIVFIALLLALILGILNATKNTEEYILAHDYLINSEDFKAQNADEGDIFFNSYSKSSYVNGTAEGYTSVAELSFYVKGTHYVVVCHEYDGTWQVCEKCTHFK